MPRACVPPQLIHDAVEADDRAAVHEEQCQERERPAARDTSVPATREFNLDRPEDPELALHLCELSPGFRAMKAF